MMPAATKTHHIMASPKTEELKIYFDAVVAPEFTEESAPSWNWVLDVYQDDWQCEFGLEMDAQTQSIYDRVRVMYTDMEEVFSR